MGTECYQVEVLHYLNPHLIWVEVTDPALSKNGDFVFEQVGIHGILALEATIDEIEGSIVTRRGDWMPAVSLALKAAFSEAQEIYFLPTHIERRTSIFDNNIHKYGDFITVSKSGKKRRLSKILVKSGYAEKDECAFYQELCSGNLKTKLSPAVTNEVITQLEKQYLKKNCSKKEWEKSVKKCTTIHNQVQSLELELTEKNLKALARDQKSLINVESLLQKKSKDFEICKDIEEVSVGRAVHRTKTKKDLNTSLLQKKLKLVEKNQAASMASVLQSTKKYLIDNAVVKDVNVSENSENKEEVPISTPNRENENNNNTSFEQENGAEVKPPPNDWMEEEYVKPRKPKKASKNRRVIPEYDTKTQQRIAYGPPEADQTLLTLKVVPKMGDHSFASHPVKIEDRSKIGEVDYDELDNRFVEKFNVNTKLEYKDDDCNVRVTNAKHTDFNVGNKGIDNDKINVKDVVAVKTKNYNDVDIDSNDHDKVKASNSFQRHLALKAQSKSNDILKKAKEMAFKQKESSPNDTKDKSPTSSLLKRKLLLHKETGRKFNTSQTSTLSNSDTSIKDSSTSFEDSRPKKNNKDSTASQSDDENIADILKKIDSEYSNPTTDNNIITDSNIIKNVAKHNVNPFKNVEAGLSVFVDKLISPILMVHSKKNNRITPSFQISDMHFSNQILNGMKILKIERPKMLQTISWLTILRGYSLFMISPKNGGKTIGYLPAVCRLICDSNNEIYSVGPICIIVCATANSVTEIDRLARVFLRQDQRVLACYSGMSELDLATSMLNGCELLICTPSILVRLLQTPEFGVDLKRLQTFVLDDCERLGEVYVNEIKFFIHKIKEMLKKRVVKELKVQMVIASRTWCDFMTPLAKKSPDTVICIGDFQECVLYSKANMQVAFVENKEKKVESLLNFMDEIDRSKKTVIVCRADDEVDLLQRQLISARYCVYSADTKMTIHDVYALNLAWEECGEMGAVLVCCDGNLYHMNVTDAHYLIHYSLPHFFSAFCRRFSVLNDNYPSIFTDDNEKVKIKIYLEEDNVEELPKIVHFIKRCTEEVPQALDKLCEQVLEEKDRMNAKKLVPICDSLLTLGECPDFWSCQERHAVIKEYDAPLSWMPKQGTVTFKITHYHTAVFYSARLLSNTFKGETTKYSQNYNKLLMKIATYYATESNRRLHGTPKIGDIAAVALKQNYFARCQVVKIINCYNTGPPGIPEYVLVKLLDEEKLEKTKDVYLYYIPDTLKEINTYVVHVRLANIKPKDKDITFSDLAKDSIKNITDSDEIFIRGDIKLAIANCLIVDKVEACRELSSMNKVVVRANFKQVLEPHAMENPEHLPNLEKLCQNSGVTVYKNIDENQVIKKSLPKPRWAHLEKDDLSLILFASAEDPSTFFVRLVKFGKCLNQLIQDIQKHMADNPEYLTDFKKGDIVLAELPDDGMYERARIDEIYEGKVKCFFVDYGDWRDVSVKRIATISEKLITQLPFQAIECRLVGVSPAGQQWTEFATNWFTNCFEDHNGDLKQMYIKYFTKEKSTYTEGHKYGVAVIDTNGEKDFVVNRIIIEHNMGKENEREIGYLDNLNFERITNESTESSDEDWEQVENTHEVKNNEVELVNEPPKPSLDNIFLKKPIRSVPLVESDNIDDEKFDFNMIEDFLQMTNFSPKNKLNDLLAIENEKSEHTSSDNVETPKLTKEENVKSMEGSKIKEVADSSSELSGNDTSSSAIVVIPSPKLNALDSDDLTSSVSSHLTEKSIPEVTEPPKETNPPLDKGIVKPTVVEINGDDLRKPKLCWRQNNENVFIKIMLIAEDYKMEIKERHLNFEAEANATKYGFDVELYGVIDVNPSKHCNKGQYILVTLKKILKRNWLTLTRSGLKKWIVYDVDHIDDSSSEEDEYCTPASVFKHTLNKSDSETDDELMDDVSFKYKRYD